MKSLLNTSDLKKIDIIDIFNFADELKKTIQNH